MVIVKYSQYSPQIMKKSGSNQLSLATASILGQPLTACFTLINLNVNQASVAFSGGLVLLPKHCS